MMVPPKLLVSTIESVLLGPASPTPLQRIELMHALRNSTTSFQSLLSYPPPKASDRAQVQSKEVRLPDSPPISLDDQDVQIALKLSEDLHLNEIDCVRLLVNTNQEWGLLGREPLEILRLAAGIWYNERKDLLTALYTLLRAVVLDRDFEGDLVADIQKYLEDLIDAGLRQRLIDLIKELNREEPAGWGGPQADRHVIDSRGILVEREAVVCRERLTLGHCIVLSVLIVRTSPKDVKDLFAVLKDCATEVNGSNGSIRFQVAFSLLFSLLIAFISDALSTVPDKASVLSHDAHFRQEFQDMVIVSGNDPQVDGFVNVIRFAWTVHLMLAQDDINVHLNSLDSSSNNVELIYSCLEVIYSKNAFQFLLDKILRTAAYQNDDEDMIYMYNAYLHKMLTCFLSHPLARDKVKEMKEKAMTSLSPYSINGLYDSRHDSDMSSLQTIETSPQPFVSLLDLVSEVYEKEPELMSGNEVLWTFVNFAGEDHTNFHTLVAFLRMLSTLASSQEGASKVFDLLQGKSFRSVGWSTLFDCLSIYDQKFKQSLQSAGVMLPDFEEGDAKALVAYLDVLQKVLKNGNPIERKKWFPDIEPLFKLLSYENVPPYLKGALRSTIAIFLQVFPSLKDTIWSYLEQYDLPVVVGLPFGASAHQISTQVYDMRFELNEVEARRERYPSTISFLNLLNALIAEERDVTDRGRRFVGIFRFVYDHVFGPFPQRAYADPNEKWELVVACLQHFRLILGMYDIMDEDSDSVVDYSQPPAAAESTSLETQIPVLELLKDFMSGKTVFRNIMSILLLGVNSIIIDRTGQVYGQLLEKAVQLCLEILILVFEKDLFLADFWRPMYQPLDTILSQDQNHIVTLLEYVRYYFQPQIQQCSIKIMSILSSRMVGLVQLLLKSSSTKCLIEDYAACLDLRSEECYVIENITEDIGVLVIQLLIDNIHRPAPNITHFLLKFEVDIPVDRTILQPKYHYSCLKVILDILDKFSKPDVNAPLHEFGFQLLYELCSDSLTCGPMMDLLSNKKYQFFLKHLHTVGVAPLPKRSNSQTLRISSLHQRAWLLKLLALELHTGDMTVPTHREACQIILTQIFSRDMREPGTDAGSHHLSLGIDANHPGIRTINKSKVLELLEVLQFRSPDTSLKYSQFVSNLKYEPQVESILGNPATAGKNGVYYYSERGDRLIDITSFCDKLWQFCSYDSESELNDLRETIQHLLRWCWKYNRNLEEQAAQLHMLTGWCQIVEISISRRMSSLDSRSEILLEVLDASLSSSASPDCSLKMSLLLSQVALTCMAKLRDERFTSPRGIDSDSFTSVDVILAKQLSNGACHSILFKLVMAILRQETSELLRRRQYALLLSYFQYCQHMLDPDVPASVLQYLLREDQDGEEYMDLKKVDKEQAELARANFSILKKEAQAILNLVTKDAVHGSEAGKTISFYVLDAFISIDQERFFLGQLQSREFLRSCLADVCNITSKDGGHSLDSLQRVYTLEAELALLLRISHKYGKSGSQVLFSMDALGHLASCKVGGFMRGDVKVSRDVSVDIDTNRLIIGPILRLVYSLISLVDTSEFFEVKNKIVREAIGFIKAHQLLIDQILRVDVSGANESTLELINLVVGVLGKVWPYEENVKSGFVQGLFSMMATLFLLDVEAFCLTQSLRVFVNQRKLELLLFKLCFSLSSYLYVLVTKKSLRLQVLDNPSELQESTAQMQPRLASLVFLLNSVTLALERASEEKSLLLNKIQDINELSRQEVDEVISMCVREDCLSSSDSIHKRRYIAMVEMCQVAGNRDQLIALLLSLAEQILNIVFVHFRDSFGTSNSGESTKMITFGAKPDSEHDISSLCGKLLPTVEKLEALSEEKVGHNLKVFRRLLSSLKEMIIQNLSL